jgi:hypothetical protein
VGVRFGGSEPRRDPGHGPPAPFPLRWAVSPLRPGMSDGGSPRPTRQRPVPRTPASAGRATGPEGPDSFGCPDSSSRGSPDAGLGRHRIPARNGTDLLRQAPTLRRAPRTCFGRPARPEPSSPDRFGDRRRLLRQPTRWQGTPPPGTRFGRHRTKVGGHEAPAHPIDSTPTSVDDGPRDGMRLLELRQKEVSHRLRPMRKVPPRIPTASAAGQSGSGHPATS